MSIIERLLYQNPDNLERLKLVLTPLNFEILNVYAVDPNSDPKLTVTTVQLDTDPGNKQELGKDRYKESQVQYPRIPLEPALRSKLPTMDNWVLMDLPDHGRVHTLTDVILYLRTHDIVLESRFFKLHMLTRDRYMLVATADSPRFMGSVTFKSVTTIPHSALPDTSVYSHYDFKINDSEYLMAWANYRTYVFCYTPENTRVVSSISNNADYANVTMVLQIDKQRHIHPNIGIPDFPVRFYQARMAVQRTLGKDLMLELGYRDALPLGYALDVRRTWDLIPRINEVYNLGISKQDIVDMAISANIVKVRFRTTCLAYAGEITVDIKGNVEIRQ